MSSRTLLMDLKFCHGQEPMATTQHPQQERTVDRYCVP